MNKNKIDFMVPPIVQEMIGAVAESARRVNTEIANNNISNIRYGPVEGNKGCISI